jgi:hypothetical protein
MAAAISCRPFVNLRAAAFIDPILDCQAGNPDEFPFIVCYKRNSKRNGMRGNPQIIISDHMARLLQFCPDL